MAERYFLGQGRIYLGDRQVNWNDLWPLGNCKSLTINVEQETFDHYEYQSGYDRQDLNIVTSTNVTVTIGLENTKRENWAVLLQGKRAIANGGGINQSITVPAAGRAFSLSSKNVVSLSIAGYQQGTDYQWRSPFGVVFIPEGSTMAGQTVTVSYTVGAAEQIWFATDQDREYYLIFDGLNIADGSQPVVVELYRVKFKPSALLDLINDDVASFQLDGTVLYDPGNNTVEAPNGGYFSILQSQPQ